MLNGQFNLIKVDELKINLDLSGLGAAILQRIESIRKKREDHPLSRIAPDVLSVATEHATRLLIADRLTDGIGKGGWAQSDTLYVRELYGEDAAARTRDSVMSTVTAALALRACRRFLRRNAPVHCSLNPGDLDRILHDELDEYVLQRWDADTGAGGILSCGRENDWSVRPSYRHTAWLMLLWLADARHLQKVETTYGYLRKNFTKTNWGIEKVATHVAAHRAFTAIEQHHHMKGKINSGELGTHKAELEGHILSRYISKVKGWTAQVANTQTAPNPDEVLPYTLFVLAEMTALHERKDCDLAFALREAMAAMIEHSKSVSGTYGVYKDAQRSPDIPLSCLACSAVLRKRGRTKEEKEFLEHTLKYVTALLGQESVAIGHSYLWPLAYLIQDIYEYLTVQEVH